MERRRAVIVGVCAVGAGGVAALLAMALVLNASRDDLLLGAAGLASSGLCALVLALNARRWVRRTSVRVQLLVTVAIALVSVALNIVVASVMMFLSTHDLQLLFILVVFGFLAAAGPTLLISGAL